MAARFEHRVCVDAVRIHCIGVVGAICRRAWKSYLLVRMTWHTARVHMSFVLRKRVMSYCPQGISPTLVHKDVYPQFHILRMLAMLDSWLGLQFQCIIAKMQILGAVSIGSNAIGLLTSASSMLWYTDGARRGVECGRESLHHGVASIGIFICLARKTPCSALSPSRRNSWAHGFGRKRSPRSAVVTRHCRCGFSASSTCISQ